MPANEPLPFTLFRQAFARAEAAALPLPEAMSLATVDAEGRPSVRMVLLKALDERGFVFYTNLGSRKAKELSARPFAALCFHWAPPVAEQVCVGGRVEAVTAQEADAYFRVRPRGSQLGAWASRQSEALESAEHLAARLAEAEARFAGLEVPRPPFWSGFRVLPDTIELWKGMPDRLHVRHVYVRGPAGFTEQRLFP